MNKGIIKKLSKKCKFKHGGLQEYSLKEGKKKKGCPYLMKPFTFSTTIWVVICFCIIVGGIMGKAKASPVFRKQPPSSLIFGSISSSLNTCALMESDRPVRYTWQVFHNSTSAFEGVHTEQCLDIPQSLKITKTGHYLYRVCAVDKIENNITCTSAKLLIIEERRESEGEGAS